MKKINIMLAEPDRNIATDLQRILERRGYVVPAIATSGAQAITQAAAIRPDLVLMEIELNGKLDGWAAAKQIRTRLDIPIIFVTTRTDEATLQHPELRAAFGCVFKPFQERDVLLAVAFALSRLTHERELKVHVERHLAAVKAAARHSEKLMWLHRYSQDLVASLELPRILERLLRAAVKMTEAAGGAVWLWGPDRADGLACRALLLDGQYTAPDELRLRPGQGIAGWVAQQGKSAFVLKAQADPRTCPIIYLETGFQTTSELAVPLGVRDHLHGVLEVLNKQSTVAEAGENGFGIQDRSLLELLATAAAIAIDNARLVDALQNYAIKLETQMGDTGGTPHATAHKLKNTLARLVGFAELLQEEDSSLPDQELRQYLRKIVDNGLKISSIVDELLAVSGTHSAELAKVT